MTPVSDRADPAGLTVASLRRLREVAHDFGTGLLRRGMGRESDRCRPRSVADLLQVGSPNMQDFSLLREIGAMDRPILLRRGAGATVEEFLLAAEYVLVHGNGKVILCESGIRTFDALRKPRFEINAIPLVKQLSHLPLVADPSQTAPRASAVPPWRRRRSLPALTGWCWRLERRPSTTQTAWRSISRRCNGFSPSFGRSLERSGEA